MTVSAVEAENIARAFAGAGTQVIACDGRPDGLYTAREEAMYYFLLTPEEPLRVGSSPCVGVSKTTGVLWELGSTGE